MGLSPAPDSDDVSASPPCDPGRRDFPGPVLTLASHLWAFPDVAMFKCWRTYTPLTPSLRTNSSPLRGSACPGSESGDHPGTAKCPEPLCPHVGVTAVGERRPASPRRALPLLHRSYGLMRQTIALRPPLASLVRPIFAGCCQPLLRNGPSRRYLCQSFLTCSDPYPGCLQGAFARFFPQSFGLPRLSTGSAHRK